MRGARVAAMGRIFDVAAELRRQGYDNHGVFRTLAMASAGVAVIAGLDAEAEEALIALMGQWMREAFARRVALEVELERAE